MPQFQQALGSTNLITVANTVFSAIICGSTCQTVTVGEDASVANYPTTDFFVARPTAAASPRRITIGSTYTFRSPIGLFKKGQIAGYVEIVKVGSTTFFQDEE